MYLVYNDSWSSGFTPHLIRWLDAAGMTWRLIDCAPQQFDRDAYDGTPNEIVDTRQVAKYDLELTLPQFRSLYGPLEEDSENLRVEWLEAFFQYVHKRLEYGIKMGGTIEPIEGVIIFSPITAAREYAAAMARQRRVPVIAIDVGPFPDSLMVERDDTGHRSRLGSPQFFRHILARRSDPDEHLKCQAYLDLWKSKRESRGPLAATVSGGTDTVPEGCTLVIGQSPTDANQIISQGPLGYRPLIICRLLVDAGAEVVFKPHPEDETATEAFERAGVGVVVDCNVHDGIQACQAVVTWNSNVGVEALVYGKPVACLGQAYYRHRQLVNVINSHDDLLRFVCCETTHVDWVRERFLVYLISRFLAWEDLAGADVVRRIEEEAVYATV